MNKFVKTFALAVMAFAAVACNDEGGKGGNKSPYSADITTPANCYIVAPGSTVRFVANIGNTAEKANFTTAELTWQDVKGMVTKVDAQADKGKVVVTLASGIEGNALVSVKDAEGKIVWNYHLWVTNYQPEKNVINYSYSRTTTAEDGTETTDNFAFVMMDRYIGALSAEAGNAKAHGLHYNWGRPAPLFAATRQTGEPGVYFTIDGDTVSNAIKQPVAGEDNIANAIANPTTHYNCGSSDGYWGWISNSSAFVKANCSDMWGGVSATQTKYDPCPTGWRVAPYQAYKFLGGDKAVEAAEVSKVFDGVGEENKNIVGWNYNINGATLYIPSCGEFNNNGGYSNGAGTNWPNGKAWTAGADADNARAWGTNISPNGASYAQGLANSYTLPVRCVKVQ